MTSLNHSNPSIGNHCSNFYHQKLVGSVFELHLNGITQLFYIWLNVFFPDLSMLLCVSDTHSFLFLCSIPFCDVVTIDQISLIFDLFPVLGYCEWSCYELFVHKSFCGYMF